MYAIFYMKSEDTSKENKQQTYINRIKLNDFLRFLSKTKMYNLEYTDEYSGHFQWCHHVTAVKSLHFVAPTFQLKSDVIVDLIYFMAKIFKSFRTFVIDTYWQNLS